MNYRVIDFIKKLPRGGEIIVQATSDSMSPVIRCGDKIRVRKIEFLKVTEQDIVAFHLADKKNIIVHRVVRVIKNQNKEIYFITKGDFNSFTDPWIVVEENFLGVVTK